MTPNDALTQLQRSHAHSRNRKTPPLSSSASSSPLSPAAPSFRRRLTRSPSPSITLGLARKPYLPGPEETMPTQRISGNSSQATFPTPPRRSPRLNAPNGTANGHANGVPFVLEEEEPVDTPRSTAIPTEKPKVDYEIPRKTLHASIGFLALALWSFSCPSRPVIQFIGSSLIVVSSAELLRLNNPWFERFYERALGFLMRDSEKTKINGVVWYLVGVLFALTIYPLDVAAVSILILSWADTAASTIGRLYGYLTPPLPRRQLYIPLPFLRNYKLGFARRKSLAGFMAATVTGFAITTAFWGYFAPFRNEPSTLVGGGWKLVGVGLISGLISGVVEALDFGSVDDNLTLPVLTGALIWGVLRLW